MIAAVVSPRSIPEFVHPPVPGESHELYGDNHLDSIKLPVSAPLQSPNAHNRFNSGHFIDPLAVQDVLNNDSSISSTTPRHEMGESGFEPLSSSRASPDAQAGYEEDSSDDVLWSRLVDGCINGLAELVQEILTQSPQLKDSIDNISSATGMNPLHFAASRGHDNVVRILIDQAGAELDIQDREGETALLKASHAGCFPVVCFLLKRGANVHQRDKDGWTALHNASSKGFIDIAQVLLEKGEADINARSKMGHTPLINAASKGDVAMVLYFLNHAKANPLLKNTFSEMAYDVAAANSEAYLCDILQTSEKLWWKGENSNEQVYDPLAIHSTVLLTVHENQRASSSFPLSLMTPKFTSSALTQQDHCGPWSLPNGRPSTKEDVHLPLMTHVGASSNRSNMQRGWFWLTEWMVDRTDPTIDSEGWQYGKSLTDANQQWSAIPPTSGGNWVRRRKWIRVMKKRVDLVTPAGEAVQGAETSQSQFGHEMAGNYMKRASLALRLADGFVDATQELARYRQAIQILLNGIKVDRDATSKQAASALVGGYLQRAEELTEVIEQQNTVYNGFRQPETPRPQIESRFPSGSAGSTSELRSLTLQKSRPSDVETLEDPIHSHAEHGVGHQSEELSEESFSSASTVDAYGSVPVGIEEMERERDPSEADGNDQQGEELGTEFSTITTNNDQELVSAANDTSLNDSMEESSSNIPIPTSSAQPHQIPEVAVISASPATAQSDPFPMARLTRNPRSSTPSISSERSQAAEAVPIQTLAARSRTQAEAEEDTDSQSGYSDSSRQLSSSFPTPSSLVSQDRSSPSRAQSMQTPALSRPQHHAHRQQQQQHHYQQNQSSVSVPVIEPKWESDHKAIECRECHRKFSLWLRRHHCRRCGHVVCDRCSSHRAMLHPSMVLYDPTSSEAYLNHQALSRRGTVLSYRVCDSCHGTLGLNRSTGVGGSSGWSNAQSSSGSQTQHQSSSYSQTPTTPGRGGRGTNSGGPSHSQYGNSGGLGVYMHGSDYAPDVSHSSSRSSSSSNLLPAPMVRNASSSSLMSECPVCGAVLAGLEGGKAAQEAHVQDCLEGKSGGQGNGPVRYVVYKLPADSPLIDQECAICFEEFVAGKDSGLMV
ncbi:hypothetical protein EDD11_000529 [Mortierella claussenii]|nr:hypothetical protein EDD11_000529 [Mortierella claussenii]